MNTYHKIQTVFKRDPNSNYKTLLLDEYSLPEFEYLTQNTWIFTEKVDGTNIRIMYKDKQITFNGKTDNAQIPGQLNINLNKMIKDVSPLFEQTFDCDVCLYGEGYGGKIQKAGATYGPEQRFVLFDIKIGDFWLQRDDIENIAQKLNLDIVPIIGQGTLVNMVEYVKTSFKSQWGDFVAEGVVARPKTELVTRNGQRIITKLKYKDFQ